jgi:hypothetical protein
MNFKFYYFIIVYNFNIYFFYKLLINFIKKVFINLILLILHHLQSHNL